MPGDGRLVGHHDGQQRGVTVARDQDRLLTTSGADELLETTTDPANLD